MATISEKITDAAKPAAEKLQAMFGDASTQAKTAMEKGSKLAEEMAELTKGNVEAVVASGRVAAQGVEALTQDAVAFGKQRFEATSAAVRSFASAKSPAEFFQLQSDYAKSSFDSAVAEASRFSEAYLKLVGEVVQPISNRVAVAAEKFKGAAL